MKNQIKNQIKSTDATRCNIGSVISPERIKSLLTETVKHEHVTGITRCRSQGDRSTVREKAAGRTARDGRSRTSPPETNVRACISINQRYQKKTPATS